MVSENMYRKLAELVVRRGVNVQKGQPVVINAHVQDAAFVRLLAEYAYQAGAKSVHVEWRDTALSKKSARHKTAFAPRERRLTIRLSAGASSIISK